MLYWMGNIAGEMSLFSILVDGGMSKNVENGNRIISAMDELFAAIANEKYWPALFA